MRINIHVSGKDAELYDKRLLHFHFTMRQNPQLYSPFTCFSIFKKEGPIHRLSNVCVQWGKDLSAVRSQDDPSNLSKEMTSLREGSSG